MAAGLLVAALSEAVGQAGVRELARRVTGLTVGPLGIELADPTQPQTPVTRLVVEAARACHDGGLLVLLDEAQEDPATAAVVRAGHRASQDGPTALFRMAHSALTSCNRKLANPRPGGCGRGCVPPRGVSGRVRGLVIVVT